MCESLCRLDLLLSRAWQAFPLKNQRVNLTVLGTFGLCLSYSFYGGKLSHRPSADRAGCVPAEPVYSSCQRPDWPRGRALPPLLSTINAALWGRQLAFFCF